MNEAGLKQAADDFLVLLNQERARVLGSEYGNLKYSEATDNWVAIRGKEDQEHFESTGDFDSHVRPDGSTYDTALVLPKEFYGQYVQEGEVESFAYSDGGENTPEGAAKRAFEELCNEPAHYDNMMTKGYKYVGITFLPTTVSSTGQRYYSVVVDFLG